MQIARDIVVTSRDGEEIVAHRIPKVVDAHTQYIS